MVPIIDSHCHVDFDHFAEDVPAVLDRARQAGLIAMICVGSGSDLATAQRAVELAALKSPKTRSALERRGIELVNYRSA